MDRSEVIYLVKETFATDAMGQRVPTLSARPVFCNVESVTRSEWYSGGQNGLRPEFRITMFKYDHHGEEIVNIGGTLEGDQVSGGTFYTVYRTYLLTTDELELYVEKRTGS